MPSSRLFRQVVAGVEARCSSGLEERALRRAVLDLLLPALHVEDYAWLLTDPQTSVGVAPLAHVRWFDELPLQIRLRYATPVNRWTTLPAPVVTLDGATGGDRGQSLVWRELLQRRGVGDVASVVFRDEFGCWAFLELFREADRGPFVAADVALLEVLVDPLTTALRHRVAESFLTQSAVVSPVGPVVLLLSPDLQVTDQTEPAASYLRSLVPPAEGRAPVPAGAYNVAAQLLAVEAGADQSAPWARTHLAGGRWVTFRAGRIGAREPAACRDIAVTIEPTDPVGRVDVFARAFALSRREREVLDHLVRGADTTEIARLMLISSSTVQDHLKSVFSKTGARSRRTLLARALGTSLTA